MNQFPPRKFAEIFASQGAPTVSTTPVANWLPVSMTPVANCRRYQRHRRQICHQYQRHWRQILPPVSLVLLTPGANLPPVSTIPAANLPPVSMTPVANCHRYQRHQRQICRRCRWHWWQIIRTISGCRHLKVNLKAKMYIYVNSTTERCPNKIIKIFQLEDFFHLPPVSLTPVVHLEPRISLRIFEKIRNGRKGILRCFGETDSWKNQKSKISWHCPFKTFSPSSGAFVSNVLSLGVSSKRRGWLQQGQRDPRCAPHHPGSRLK